MSFVILNCWKEHGKAFVLVVEVMLQMVESDGPSKIGCGFVVRMSAEVTEFIDGEKCNDGCPQCFEIVEWSEE